LELKEMRTRFVYACDQKTNAVGSLAVVLGIGLGAVADGGDEAFEGEGAAVDEARREGLLFHEVGEDAGVGGEAGEGEADVFVDGDDFLLVRGEFFCVALGRAVSVSFVRVELILEIEMEGMGLEGEIK
jgi:hypothetical protein